MPRHDAGQECKCQEAFEPWTDAVKINAKCSLNLVFEHPQRCKWQQSKKNILKHPILQYFAYPFKMFRVMWETQRRKPTIWA